MAVVVATAGKLKAPCLPGSLVLLVDALVLAVVVVEEPKLKEADPKLKDEADAADCAAGGPKLTGAALLVLAAAAAVVVLVAAETLVLVVPVVVPNTIGAEPKLKALLLLVPAEGPEVAAVAVAFNAGGVPKLKPMEAPTEAGNVGAGPKLNVPSALAVAGAQFPAVAGLEVAVLVTLGILAFNLESTVFRANLTE